MVKSKKQAYRNTSVNIIKIFRILKRAAEEEEGFLTVSEIAKRASLHKWTVSRTLDLYMGPIIDIVQPPELEAIGLQVKLVSLTNPELKPDQVISYLKMRSKVNA